MAEALYQRSATTGRPISDIHGEFAARQPGAARALIEGLILNARNRRELEHQTIGNANERKKEKAVSDYEAYVELARDLVAERPALRRATINQLAIAVQKRLAERGQRVTARTIAKALKK
jgi:hypothetical protein